MRLKYKIGFAALAVIVIIGIAFYAVANNSESLNTTNVDFEDVNESDWFYGDVEYAVQNGLMNGTGDKIFAPEESTTRGMIVTILWRAEGKPASETDISFIDVEETAYYYGAVKWAAENKIVTGYDNLHFGADDAITREQIAAILYRYAGYKGYDTSTNASLDKYADKDQISDYAVSAFEWATGCNIITGTSETTLSPDGNAERCQAAAMLRRFKNWERDAENNQKNNEKFNKKDRSEEGETVKGNNSSYSETLPENDEKIGESVDVENAKIKLKTTYGKAGDTIPVVVDLRENPGILGAVLSLEYDESAMTLVDVENGEAVADVLTLTHSKEFESGMNFVWDGLELDDSDVKEGTMMVLYFELSSNVIPGKRYPLKLDYKPGSAIDEDLNKVNLIISQGFIEIEENNY